MGDMADFALVEMMDEDEDGLDGWSRGIYRAEGFGHCPMCGGETTIRIGLHGPFHGCKAWPSCNGNRAWTDTDSENSKLEQKMSKQQYTPKPGTFSLFANRYKEPGDNKPDYTGNGAGLDGTPLQIAAWRKIGNGGEYLSVSISVPRQQQQPKPEPQPATDDDAPF